jgi:hypothetical protein
MNNNKKRLIYLWDKTNELLRLLDKNMPYYCSIFYSNHGHFVVTQMKATTIYLILANEYFDGNVWVANEFVNELTILFKIYNEIYINATIWCKKNTELNKYWKEFVSYMEEMGPLLIDTINILDEKCIEAIEVNRMQMYNDKRWMNVRDIIMAGQLRNNNILYAIPSELTKHICEFVQ